MAAPILCIDRRSRAEIKAPQRMAFQAVKRGGESRSTGLRERDYVLNKLEDIVIAVRSK
jgi:hypothetical protein